MKYTQAAATVWPELLALRFGPTQQYCEVETSMKRISRTMVALLVLGACAASTAALAADPLGIYVGAGLGESTIRSDDPAYGLPAYFNDHETDWKAFVGFRPIDAVGVEAEYIDFGQPGHHYDYNVAVFGNDSHPRAGALFAVGYLPIPVPFLDIFGKAGVARLTTNVATSYTSAACGNGATCVSINQQEETNDKFAYGVGIQSKFPFGFTVRAEYERISSTFGDPDALTVSALWNF